MDVWARAYADGSAAYPDVALDRAAFGAAVAAMPPSVASTLTHGAELFLAIAGVAGDPAALRHVDDLLAEARPSLRRYDPTDAFAAEVLQRVRIHLFVASEGAPPRLARYDGRASLRAWLGVCATRMGLYVLRTIRNRHEVGDWTEEIVAVPTGQPELEEVRARYADAFGAAWREACAALSARHRSVLRMCFVENCPIETIAATYGVHRVTVWRWLDDAKQKLLDGTRARLGERLTPDDPGTQSLLELVRSQLDLGLSQLDLAS
jgi:RNA polymerase sigma-70 factor (ECF subfamily)